MAMTYQEDWQTQELGVSATISISSAGWKTGDFITLAVVFASETAVSAESVSNDGSAIAWQIIEQAADVLNARIVLYAGAVTGPTPPGTISVTATAGSVLTCRKALFIAAHRGAASNKPGDMMTNVWIGTGGADVTQSIPASGHGSCYWFVCADANATNTFAAAAGCELLHVYDNASFTGAAIAPQQQPLQSGIPFTIGESDTGARVAWMGWEVRAAPDYWLMGQAML